MKCPICGESINKIKCRKYKLGYPVFMCIKCNKMFYEGDPSSKIIIKDGIKYYNIKA